MDVKEAIKRRRSVRKYQSKEISDDLIKEVIDAARLAPSGNNTQPSRYLIVRDNQIKDRLRENEVFKQDFVYEAPIIVVCCADPSIYKDMVKEWDIPNEDRALRDLSIASFSLVLRATELGLGTCYVGWIKEEKIKEVLDIPKGYIVPYVIILGYSAEQPRLTPRNSIDEIIL